MTVWPLHFHLLFMSFSFRDILSSFFVSLVPLSRPTPQDDVPQEGPVPVNGWGTVEWLLDDETSPDQQFCPIGPLFCPVSPIFCFGGPVSQLFRMVRGAELVFSLGDALRSDCVPLEHGFVVLMLFVYFLTLTLWLDTVCCDLNLDEALALKLSASSQNLKMCSTLFSRRNASKCVTASLSCISSSKVLHNRDEQTVGVSSWRPEDEENIWKIITHKQQRNISSRFFNSSEAPASELLENLEEMLLWHYIHNAI